MFKEMGEESKWPKELLGGGRESFRTVSALRQIVHLSDLGCGATGAVHNSNYGVSSGGLSIIAPIQ